MPKVFLAKYNKEVAATRDSQMKQEEEDCRTRLEDTGRNCNHVCSVHQECWKLNTLWDYTWLLGYSVKVTKFRFSNLKFRFALVTNFHCTFDESRRREHRRGGQ